MLLLRLEFIYEKLVIIDILPTLLYETTRDPHPLNKKIALCSSSLSSFKMLVEKT